VLTTLYVHLHALWLSQTTRAETDERGQATAEYALILLGAAAIALLVVGWATKSGTVGKLLDAVFDNIRNKVK
jgi:Flp pilus assembly pilin Flp